MRTALSLLCKDTPPLSRLLLCDSHPAYTFFSLFLLLSFVCGNEVEFKVKGEGTHLKPMYGKGGR